MDLWCGIEPINRSGTLHHAILGQYDVAAKTVGQCHHQAVVVEVGRGCHHDVVVATAVSGVMEINGFLSWIAHVPTG